LAGVVMTIAGLALLVWFLRNPFDDKENEPQPESVAVLQRATPQV